MKRNIMIHILKHWLLFICFQFVKSEVVGRVKISDFTSDVSVIEKNLRMCLGVMKDPSYVDVFICTKIPFASEGQDTVNLSIDFDKIFSHIIIFDEISWEKVNVIEAEAENARKVSVRDVLDYAATPLLSSGKEHPLSTIKGMKFKISVDCEENRFGTFCLRYCDASGSVDRYFCHPETGKMICRQGWVGKDCSTRAIPSHISALQLLKIRPKRSQDEQRDCSRRRCSPEEMIREFSTSGIAFRTDVEMDFRQPENLSVCSEEACDHDGTKLCMLDEGQPVCKCKSGYSGARCSEIDKCFFELCQNGGACQKLEEGGSICNCAEGFEGENCEKITDLCFLEPCGLYGKCEADASGFRCHCLAGFVGETCEVNIDDCVNVSCSGNGQCYDGLNSYDCACNEGYHGKNCELKLDGCSSEPCENGGECTGYQDGSYECSCPAGYKGATCSEEVENPCHPDPCNGHGICYATLQEEDSEYVYERVAHCSCNAGYGGEYCETADSFCDESHSSCPSNSTCVSLSGEYTCVCPPGYEGEFCEKECDECEDMNALHCEESPCKNGAKCVAIGEEVRCICGNGYYGPRCENVVDYCTESPCKHGVCQSVFGRFECLCDEGFTGKLCDEDINECEIEHKLCKNDGECFNLYGGYECNCLKGYVGEHCDHKLDACSNEPCLHGGTCLPKGQYSYVCHCALGYIGWNCENQVECEVNPCLNGGKCELTPLQQHEYRCHCDERHFGQHCEKEIPACKVKREKSDGLYELLERTECANGICRPDGKQSFKCECYEGYEGKFCDQKIKITECKDSYCVCESGLPNRKHMNTKNKNKPGCKHQFYGSGSCVLDDCLKTTCAEAPKIVCQFEQKCLEKVANPRLPQARREVCEKLLISFNRAELPEGATLQGICENIRQTEVAKEFDNVATKCYLKKRTNTSVKISVSFEAQLKPNARAMREKFFKYLKSIIIANNFTGILGDAKVSSIGAIESINDGGKTVKSEDIRNSANIPGKITTRPQKSSTNLIIGIICASLFVLTLLVIGIVVWMKKRKPLTTATPAEPHSENNNVLISSVKFSKNENGKANPLFSGANNDSFSYGNPNEERISTIKLPQNSNTTDTNTSPTGLVNFTPSDGESFSNKYNTDIRR